MNKIHHTIEDILMDWGHKQHILPIHNETLKSEIIAKLQSSSLEKQIVPQRMPWFSLAFASLAVITLIINYLPNNYPTNKQFITPPIQQNTRDTITNTNPPHKLYTSPIQNSYIPGAAAPQMSQQKNDSAYPMRPFPYPTQISDIPVTDTREFLKIDYNAGIRTRHVEEMAQHIQTIVRGFNGRVDSSRSSKGWGFVSFVVPASKFDSFKTEIESLTGSKLLVENITNENLLPQKQSIEQQQQAVEDVATQLQNNRKALSGNHQRIINSIQSEINKIESDITDIKIKLDVTSDPIKRNVLAIQLQNLLNEKSGLETNLTNENAIYLKKLSDINTQIRNTQVNLDGLAKQDQKLIDTVATISGTITLNWISIWEIIQLYVPLNLWFMLFTIGAIATYVIHRRRSSLYLHL